MNIGGRYLTKASLASWGKSFDNGGVPSLWTEFEFLTRKGPSERLPMWSMVDTGADVCVVPALALGILLPDDGSPPEFITGEIGARLQFVPTSIKGIGGSVEGLSVRTVIKLAGRELPGIYDVVVGGNLEYPVIGRDVLNKFVGVFNPGRQRLNLSAGMVMKTMASCARFV